MDLFRHHFFFVLLSCAVAILAILSVDGAFVPNYPRKTTRGDTQQAHLFMSKSITTTKGMDKVVVVQTGCGCCHGRNVTKAAIRACRDAIEYNSVKIRTIIPGGYEAMKMHVQLGVPDININGNDDGINNSVDFEAVAKEFPYGTLLPIVVERGGLLASNGVKLAGTGESKEDMTLAVACVTIGYDD